MDPDVWQDGLEASEQPLTSRYDVAMLDLDGVVYIGAASVPGAPEHLEAAASAGVNLAYITNNAARPPSVVAQHLTELGIPAGPCDVVTAAQAAARLVTERVSPGSAVFVIGGLGLFEALGELGLRGVQEIDEHPAAVVSGYHPDLRWRTVIDGSILVRRGLPWVASNTDLTVPTAHGAGPGNGVLVRAVAEFAGRAPDVAGKPQPPLFEETLRRVSGERPIVVGDRLDTDIEGARNAGYDSLLVMTGVTGIAELVAAHPESRPTYVAADLAGLTAAQPIPEWSDDAATAELGGWTARVDAGVLGLTGHGSLDDWWRLVAEVAWRHLDTTGDVVSTADLAPPVA